MSANNGPLLDGGDLLGSEYAKRYKLGLSSDGKQKGVANTRVSASKPVRQHTDSCDDCRAPGKLGRDAKVANKIRQNKPS